MYGKLDYDIITAIDNAKEMDKQNRSNYKEINYKGYGYYEVNPSLSVHLIIEKILRENKILKTELFMTP